MGADVIVDIQFNQGAADWPRMRELVIAAEEAGFGTLWNLDHYSGRMFGADSMNECFSSLSAWAAVTSTIKVGTLVTNVMNRSAGLLAVSAATVQNISCGRFTLGLGAGAAPGSPWGAEQDALGIPMLPRMADRHARLAAVVDEMRSILSPSRDTRFDGFPVAGTPIPTIVGVNSASLAEYAGRHCDGVNVGFHHEKRAEFVRVAREAAGDRPFDASVWDFFVPEMCDPTHPANAAHRANGCDHTILLVKGAPDPSVIAGCGRYLR